ncbi:Uroporphyrinogen decarboxylase [Pelagophyceae sp. CCMP2097]|nr:Uroporphyrinogen decarboxylase [Pelagophyceae sp. CCMP2097]
MAEYNAYKEKTGKHFLQLLEDPKDVAEVTLQPLRRYAVDAAILFSDILVVPQALGVDVEMPGGKGIVVPRPCRTGAEASALAKLASKDPAALVKLKLKHVTDAVSKIRRKQLEEGLDCTLIGFSAAPWTLLYYTVGASSKNKEPALAFMRDFPKEAQELLDGYCVLVEEYLSAQVDAGAHALQVFEAMAMTVDEQTFADVAMPRMRQLACNLKRRHPDVPLLVFARGVENPMRFNTDLASCGYDVVTIDTVADRRETRYGLGKTCLQGNFDPKFLLASESSAEKIREEVRTMFSGFGGPSNMIANLGEGLMGKEDQQLVDCFVDCVHDISAEMLRD